MTLEWFENEINRRADREKNCFKFQTEAIEYALFHFVFLLLQQTYSARVNEMSWDSLWRRVQLAHMQYAIQLQSHRKSCTYKKKNKKKLKKRETKATNK